MVREQRWFSQCKNRFNTMLTDFAMGEQPHGDAIITIDHFASSILRLAKQRRPSISVSEIKTAFLPQAKCICGRKAASQVADQPDY
jgi:hypothetical protein